MGVTFEISRVMGSCECMNNPTTLLGCFPVSQLAPLRRHGTARHGTARTHLSSRIPSAERKASTKKAATFSLLYCNPSANKKTAMNIENGTRSHNEIKSSLRKLNPFVLRKQLDTKSVLTHKALFQIQN